MNLLNLNNIDHVHSATWTLYPKYESNTDALIMLKVNLKIFKKATFHVLVKNVSSHDQNRFQHLSREIWPGLAPAQKCFRRTSGDQKSTLRLSRVSLERIGRRHPMILDAINVHTTH